MKALSMMLNNHTFSEGNHTGVNTVTVIGGDSKKISPMHWLRATSFLKNANRKV